MRSSLRGLLAATLLCFTVPALGSAQINLTGDISGSLADTLVDLDLSGSTTAVVGSGGGSSSLGPLTWRTVTEVEELPVANVNCPPAELEFLLVDSSAVLRLDPSGILVYLVLDPASDSWFCADLLTGAFSGQVSTLVVGGTGPASGATGTVVLEFTGVTLLADVTGDGRFSGISGTIAGTIFP